MSVDLDKPDYEKTFDTETHTNTKPYVTISKYSFCKLDKTF